MTLRVAILTPFPEMVKAVIGTSILERAVERGAVEYNVVNLFDYADEPHRKIDDQPFGGGAGMILKPEPIFRAYEAAVASAGKAPERVLFPTPDGVPFSQKIAGELAQVDEMVIISGHYKGVDQRVRDQLVTDEISIGDFVVTGGEIPGLLMLDAIVRLREGALNTSASAATDSFSAALLDGPHYTRPRNYRGAEVPEVLLSGDHGRIADWRQAKREEQTRKRRPDLWERYEAAGLIRQK